MDENTKNVYDKVLTEILNTSHYTILRNFKWREWDSNTCKVCKNKELWGDEIDPIDMVCYKNCYQQYHEDNYY